MRLALKKARSGLGLTAPNPTVGCVIIHDEKVISSSRTKNHGRPHSEAIALQNIPPQVLAQSTMYITMEPCCHRNIKDQTCVEKIILSKISRVVIGAIDPKASLVLETVCEAINNRMLLEAPVELLKGSYSSSPNHALQIPKLDSKKWMAGKALTLQAGIDRGAESVL